MRPALVLVIALMALSACARPTLTRAQCRADWREVGIADGHDGAAAGKIEAYRAACARSGALLTEADRRAWLEGWRRGALDPSPARVAPRRRADERPHPRITPQIAVGVGPDGARGGVGLGFDLGGLGLSLGWGF